MGYFLGKLTPFRGYFTIELTAEDIHRLRAAMQTIGTPAFFDAYRHLFEARLPFGTFLLIRFDPGRVPVLLNQWVKPGKPLDKALSEYIETTYPFDPFYQFEDLPEGGGLYRLPEIAPDRFLSSEYFLEYYSKTGLCDEIGLLAALPSGARAHLSLSRFMEMGPYRRREIQFLKHHAPLLLELLAQHMEAMSQQDADAVQAGSQSLTDLIQSHAGSTLNTRLTAREAQIAALVLQGHSNRSAALVLGVSRETCKVHRRNLYRKLAISSQRDLFGLLKHLL